MNKISDLNRENIELISTALGENKINSLTELISFLGSKYCSKKSRAIHNFDDIAKIKKIKNDKYCEIFSAFGEFKIIYYDPYYDMDEVFGEVSEAQVIVINCFKSAERIEKPISLRIRHDEFNDFIRMLKISTILD